MNATHAAFTEVLLHFQNDADGFRGVEALADYLDCLVDGREGAFGELHVDGGSGDLNYFAYVLSHNLFIIQRLKALRFVAPCGTPEGMP